MGARDEACADCTETLELSLQAGQTYFVVVDGYSDQFNEAGSYELEIIPPEGTYVPIDGLLGHYRGDGMDHSGHGDLNTVGQNLEIGRTAFDHSAEPFSGALDDVRIYDRVLSPAELDALYAEDGWQ